MVGLSRILSVILAAIALLWVLRVSSVGFDPSPPGMRAVTERLISGQQFDSDVLAKFDAATSKALRRDLCVADELKAVSMIRLARAQRAYADKFNTQNDVDGSANAGGGAAAKGASVGRVSGAKPASVPSTAAVAPRDEPSQTSDAVAASSNAALPGVNGIETDAAPKAVPPGDPSSKDGAKQDLSKTDAELAARFDDLGEAAVTNLYCSPYQSLAWTILALGEYLANGHTPRLDTLIDFSYRTGPFEGWPLARRLDLLVSIAPDLTPAQDAMLKDQISAVIDSDLHPLLAILYLQQDEPHQAILRSIFAEMSPRDQNLLVDLVRRAGSDLDLPQVAPRGARPWDG